MHSSQDRCENDKDVGVKSYSSMDMLLAYIFDFKWLLLWSGQLRGVDNKEQDLNSNNGNSDPGERIFESIDDEDEYNAYQKDSAQSNI